MVVAAFLVATCAGYAWFISQPFDATRGAIAIGLLMLGMGAGWFLSGTPLAPELRRFGVGRPSTTRERRISYGLMFAAIASMWAMQAVLGRQPSFLPAFAWLFATLGVLTLVHFSVHRQVPTA